MQKLLQFSARRLIGSRIIESVAYCNLIAGLIIPKEYIKTSVSWIVRLMLSLLCWPKVILLSDGHCICIILSILLARICLFIKLIKRELKYISKPCRRGPNQSKLTCKKEFFQVAKKLQRIESTLGSQINCTNTINYTK